MQENIIIIPHAQPVRNNDMQTQIQAINVIHVEEPIIDDTDSENDDYDIIVRQPFQWVQSIIKCTQIVFFLLLFLGFIIFGIFYNYFVKN
jgi:preprotein translocase subunit SecY